jgi:hypothetical protein
MFHISDKGTIFGVYKDAYAPVKDLKNYSKDAFICNDQGEKVPCYT